MRDLSGRLARLEAGAGSRDPMARLCDAELEALIAICRAQMECAGAGQAMFDTQPDLVRARLLGVLEALDA
jgi:hypothetical protein